MTTADDESGRREANRTQAAREARAWVARLTSGSATQADADALAIWRSTPEHEAEFQAASRLWRQAGQAIASPQAARETLGASRGLSRRLLLRRTATGLAAASMAASGAAVALRWSELTADYRTGTGEIRSVALPDGTRLELDAETALDASLAAEERTFILQRRKILLRLSQMMGTLP